MNTPIHQWKEHVVYADGAFEPHWNVDARPCWLGSGIKDKHGREIYEGDVVRTPWNASVVRFIRATFQVDGCWLGSFAPHEIEIIGHVAEDEP